MLMHIHAYQGIGSSQLFLNHATLQPAMTDIFNYLELPGVWNQTNTAAISKTVHS